MGCFFFIIDVYSSFYAHFLRLHFAIAYQANDIHAWGKVVHAQSSIAINWRFLNEASLHVNKLQGGIAFIADYQIAAIEIDKIGFGTKDQMKTVSIVCCIRPESVIWHSQ